MKKLLVLLLLCGMAFGSQAQEKNFQIGLTLGPTFNWLKINTTKIERNGIGAGFTVGLGGNYLFNKNIGVAFGVQFDLESFKTNYGSATNTNLGDVFYAYTDTDILKYDDNKTDDIITDDVIEGVDEGDTAHTAFLLNTRKFKAKYITVPVFLKFQTNKIGSMIYYGKFGLRTSFLAGVRMDDTGSEALYDETTKNFAAISTSEVVKPDMKPDAVKKGLTFVRTAVGIYGGAEWNFTGNTYLYGELGFNYGITPGLYQKSSHLADRVDDGSGGYNYSQLNVQNNPQHILELKIGILF